MALQDPTALSMVTLGTVGDAPPTDLQPPLLDGMHLRWMFGTARGFPWYGYYLFRRPGAREQRDRCLHPYLKEAPPGPWPATTYPTPIGTLASDRPLVFTEDFPPDGFAEVDLADRSFVALRLPAGTPARRARVTIGFREGAGDARRCVDFGADPPGEVANPLERDGATLVTYDATGSRRPAGRITSIGGSVGWDVGFVAEIALPCPSRTVEVTLRHSSRPAAVIGYDPTGRIVATAEMTDPGPQTLVLSADDTADGIVALKLDAPQDETVLLRLCWTCADGGAAPPGTEIPVRALHRGVPVASAVASGGSGDVGSVVLVADAIDEVVVGTGAAALVDLCVVLAVEDVAAGWELLPDVEYPLCLPVAHGDYACPGAPGSMSDAESRALGRIRYGDPNGWAGGSFLDLHARMERLVVGGPPPGGEPMHQRADPVPGTPAPAPGAGGVLSQQAQRPLDLLLLGSLDPAVAELLALAWVDRAAVPGERYDYLLVADHDGSLGGTPASALQWVREVADYSVNDGCVVFDRVVAPAPPLPAPTGLRAYSLPGATATPSGAPLDATNNAGLVWDRQETPTTLLPGAPVLYHVWRADLGAAPAPPVPGPDDFGVLTKGAPLPVSRSRPVPPTVPPRPGDWPPFALHHIDRARPDGWYAYRVTGIDIFGRHSPASASAQWWQWAPQPSPRPWYYVDPPADRMLDPAAIRLLDKTAPPPPPGVEAFALAPDDPTVLRDPAWQSWRDSLTPAERESVVGLRVRWLWTERQREQAPDVRAFGIYYHPAPVNTLRGRVTGVLAASATESEVLTDIPNSQPAGSYSGLSVRVGAASYRITGSDVGTPLRLRVANVGPTDAVRPADRSRCAVVIPAGHPAYEDFGAAPAWQARLLTVGFDEHVTVEAGGLRRYEVLLPVAGSPDRAGLPLVTPLDEPVATGVVAVTAVDGARHTPDHRGDPQRFGNESRVGGPATVLRIRREKPPAPPVPEDGPRLFGSPADYGGSSFFTYRWRPAARLRTLVFRALDDGVFRRDFATRPRPPLGADHPVFPPEAVDPRWNIAKRQQVAAELNALNALAGGDVEVALRTYHGLSDDGLRVLAALPGVEAVFMQVTPQPLDPDEPDPAAPGGLRWRRVGPDVPPDALDPTERAWVDRLDGRAGNRWFYRSAYVDEVHNVGALGLSSPPVWLPRVTPPRAPVLVRIRGGDRRISLEWAANREADLVAYRIYRTADPDRSRDPRLMDLVHTVAVPAGDPADRPPTVAWVDQPVPGLVTFAYRVVAVDDAGNVSAPSSPGQGRAHDLALPEPPEPALSWVTVGSAVRAQLEWTSEHEVRVQRRSGSSWIDLTSWRPPGTVVIRDPFSDPANAYTYRLWARKDTSAVARGEAYELEAR